MNIEDTLIEEFCAAWQHEYGEPITAKKARMKLGWLVRLHWAVAPRETRPGTTDGRRS